MTGTVSAAPLRPLMMLRLIAGRGAFRLSVQVMAVALLATWGAETYGRFTNALGLCTWLVFLPTAAEKAALKVLPRTRLLSAHVAGLALRIAAAPVLLLVCALAVALLVAPSSTVTLYLCAATWSASTGLLMTVSGLHRLRGRPVLDAVAFGVAAALVIGATATAWYTGWSPRSHLLVLVAGIAVIIGCTVHALPPSWVRRQDPSGRRLLPAFGRSTWLLGITELLDAVTLSSIFLVLAVAGRVTDSGPFYLALMASSFICSFLLYQLKLHQPATSARLRGQGAAGGRERAYALLRSAEFAGLAFVALLVSMLALPPTRQLLVTEATAQATLAEYLVLGVLVLIEMVMAIVLMYAGFLLENTNSRVLTITSGAAVVRLAATLLCAAALVPPLGAIGGFCAIVLALGAEAAALRRMLLRQHPELTAHTPVRVRKH
ncbi:hypothetical protein SAMN05216266_107192 [Amycolatopsis marina]|uniref:Membrane protein involved in the export of O-antigen and teichoic acid n=1 Tax=Amycolatopsis marina TaxID=490629 RepID=A0A1I0ZQ20_9PSEU|nr:hypothetical protein [Amycolatopsis marina]SFB27755.1 hypothetical protein SAMN05216266_107192 [Amycolatopsis marina]